MDIEDLMAVEVTSLSKYKQPLINTPAAITVINSQDIRQSGFKEVPELLMLAPGMQVVREDEANWSVSARSFPLEGNRKMLVMADGRSIFSQDTGTVNWVNQGFFIEDIETIEVIRGPGGTSWGYNAVNGVVNITSKKPEDTQGVLTNVSVGTAGNKEAQARLGGNIREKIFYKLYFTGSGQDGFENTNGPDVGDEFKKFKTGLRMDFHPDDRDMVSIEGAVTKTNYQDTFDTEDNFNELFVMGRWDHTFTKNLNFKLLTHYDNSDANYYETQSESAFSVGIQQFNTEVQLDALLGERHHLITGAGFKHTKFSPSDGYQIHFYDSNEIWDNYSFFISDEYLLVKNRLWVTLGTKMENNTNTDFGWQPNARLLFKPRPDQSVWMAVSRALRSPDFRDSARRIVGNRYPDGAGGFVTDYETYTGTPLEDEGLTAYEAGYRFQLPQNLSSEIAVFYNDYDHLLSKEMIYQDANGIILDNSYENKLTTYGSEISLTWKPHKSWQVSGSYAYLFNDYRFEDLGTNYNEHSYTSRFQLHAHVDATDLLGLDAHLFWNNASQLLYTIIPEYLRLDLGITYRATDHLEISLVGQNLLDPGHTEIEWPPYMQYRIEIPRNISLQIKVVF